MPFNIDVVCVCRRPAAWVADAVADYCGRLGNDFRVTFHYVAPAPDKMGTDERLRDESRRMQKRIPAGRHLIALDVSGRSRSSEDFAVALDRVRQQHGAAGMLIGGADGLEPELVQRAAARWSLSPLTLPHQLVQVVLAEQLYRAATILGGHPYHRA